MSWRRVVDPSVVKRERISISCFEDGEHGMSYKWKLHDHSSSDRMHEGFVVMYVGVVPVSMSWLTVSLIGEPNGSSLHSVSEQG